MTQSIVRRLALASALVIATPLAAQDGSGAPQRTPDSAHSFFSQLVTGNTVELPFKWYECNKWNKCGPHKAVTVNLPIRINSYAHNGPCLTKMAFTAVDERAFRSKASSLWRSITITPLAFNGSQYTFSTYRVSQDGSLKSPEYFYQNASAGQIDWTQVAQVSSYSGKTSIQFRDQSWIYIVPGSDDLAKRLAAAGEFLRVACDKTASTGF